LAVRDSGDPHTATAHSRRPSPTMAAAPLSQPRNQVNMADTMRGGPFKGRRYTYRGNLPWPACPPLGPLPEEWSPFLMRRVPRMCGRYFRSSFVKWAAIFGTQQLEYGNFERTAAEVYLDKTTDSLTKHREFDTLIDSLTQWSTVWPGDRQFDPV